MAMPSRWDAISKSSQQNVFARWTIVISEAPYFDGCKKLKITRDFVNEINGMEQFFEWPNFANNIKVRNAKLKLIGGAQLS